MMMNNDKPLIKKIVELPRFRLKDFAQVVVGATILAVPVSFTQEVWELGINLPLLNIFLLMVLSIILIGLFTYYHYHNRLITSSYGIFVSRVLVTYISSFLVVSLILGLVQQAPWGVDNLLAFKRSVIVSLPASMSAAVVDKL